MGGHGWESFPRFLYATNRNGCNMADVGCLKEADMFTISILENYDDLKAEYGQFVFRNNRHSGVNSLSALKSKEAVFYYQNLKLMETMKTTSSSHPFIPLGL